MKSKHTQTKNLNVKKCRIEYTTTEYRKNMIDKLKCGRFITDHGFAENYNAVTGEGLRDRALFEKTFDL